ncbi:hypothetical protein [Pedobacter sp. MW01-1-1]|uniref:hypothetical protein n=1 Tax=Pedobacter sp. MW01-1-1 TaxID=3383027 RepID=UPI003FEE31B7
MKNENLAQFERVISMEQLEPRLELAVAKDREVSVEIGYDGGFTGSVGYKVSF